MGWTVLYIAFGIVALWLLGEVLLQYKARLRWRLLAFVGFLGVVVGVLIPSVVVIGLGAAAFAVGQTYVTLSFRRGFASGWAVSAPGLTGSRRRRGERGRRKPTLEVTGLEAADGGHDGDGHDDGGRDDGAGRHRDGVGHGRDDDFDHDDVFTPARPVAPTAAETTAVYEPQPFPDDTGSYGVHGDPSHTGADQDQYATAAPGADPAAYPYDGYTGYDQQGYDYGATDRQQYAAYADPYAGTHAYGDGSQDPAYGDPQQHGQGYGQDPYPAGSYGGETPAGGVWVPQQRSTDEPYGGELPPEQPYPYQGEGHQGQGHGGFGEQYRF
ncbi:hypothetical protein ACIBAI_09155 [Streptomyces sp. NPDC051041]|uniref:SCO2102 family sporulation regulator n=1 Tax=Streptomyces sp. NPDC051041 TaxID=3365640 RepID=UPI00379C43BA